MFNDYTSLCFWGTAFEDDPTNYFVSGSGANEALEMVNEIICFFKNTRAKNSSMTALQGHRLRRRMRNSQCGELFCWGRLQEKWASSGDKKGTTAEQKTGSTAILNVTRGDAETDPVITKGWFALILKEEMGPGQTMEMFIDVFIDMVRPLASAPTILRASGQCATRYPRARTYSSARVPNHP